MIDMKKLLAVSCACICFMSVYGMGWQALDVQKKTIVERALGAIKGIQGEAQEALKYAASHQKKEAMVLSITSTYIGPMSTLQESITQLLKEFNALRDAKGDVARGKQIVASIGKFAEQLEELQPLLTIWVDKLSVAVNQPRKLVQPPAGPQPAPAGQQPAPSATAAPAEAVEAAGQQLVQLAEEFARAVDAALKMSDPDRRKQLLRSAGENPENAAFAAYVKSGSNQPAVVTDYIARVSAQLDAALQELGRLLQAK